jgi:DNA-binding response OmpR family regulator
MSKGMGMHSRLLVVDGDAQYAEWLRHHLGALCPDAIVSALHLTEFEHWSDMLAARDCDVLLLSAPFGTSPEDPQARGLEMLRNLRGRPVCPAIICIAEDGNELTAVRALQLGAVDYLPKRLLTPERLKTAVRVALRRIEKRVARKLAILAHGPDPGMTNAQPQVAALLEGAEGHRAAEAAGGNADAADNPGQRSEEGAAPEASAPVALPSPLPEANFIDGYTIRALIGESEKAAVYLATSASLGRDVALKVSKTQRDDAGGKQFLEREYTAIVAVRDPRVVQIYDYGVQGGYEYIAMEYLARGDLKARMQLGLTEEEALRYVEQIAAALQVVHNAGLIHRDLKPPNVMLRENGDVALIDFGLARSLDGTTQSTRTGVLRGSPYYMSPEQAQGDPLDVRSDFYSLGIILFEMLTGRRPFLGSSAIEVLQQHVNTPLPPLPSSLAHHEPLLDKLLAKSRDQRFARAEEIIAAAAAVRESLAIESRSTAA